ncbi:MAG: hypothetical protein V7L20_31625 [Nostoc sp.]|uniref:hypothetical protein n=1 Tax=Nostoc sp. TaxID=1180 RepID=UPI002FF5E80B
MSHIGYKYEKLYPQKDEVFGHRESDMEHEEDLPMSKRRQEQPRPPTRGWSFLALLMNLRKQSLT